MGILDFKSNFLTLSYQQEQLIIVATCLVVAGYVERKDVTISIRTEQLHADLVTKIMASTLAVMCSIDHILY